MFKNNYIFFNLQLKLMSSKNNKKLSSNDLLSKVLQTLPKSKKTVEQQDNESLNTMDYYKEENSSRNQKLDDNKIFTNKLSNQNEYINSNENTNLSFAVNKNYSEQNMLNLYETVDTLRIRPHFVNKNEKNVEKRFEEIKVDNDYCSRCNQEIEYVTKVCRHCFKPLCRKCIKEIFNRNLDNNDDSDNFDQNLINQKICPNCRKLNTINDFIITKSKTFSSTLIAFKEPLDTELDNDATSSQNPSGQNSVLLNDLEDQYNENELLLKKIEIKKKEIETKKKLNINILNIIQKSIEYEYDTNIKKLNEICFKLKKIQNIIKDKKMKYDSQNMYNNSDLQILIKKFKNSMNACSKNYEKIEQRIISKSKPKAFKIYESKPLTINVADTYSMKKTQVISNQYIGNAYIHVQKCVNNYVNYLNFSVLVQQNNKKEQNNNNKNKSVLVPYIVINNQLIKLNKTNKDNNKSSLNYEYSLEESKAFPSKNCSGNKNNNIKKDEFDVKLIISELFL